MRFAGSQPRFFQACHRAIGGHMSNREVFGNFGQSALAIALDEIRDRLDIILGQFCRVIATNSFVLIEESW
jgi:hypothetical protein